MRLTPRHGPLFVALLPLLAALHGCAKATVNPTVQTAGPLPKPDMLVVENFAVTAGEIKLDRGLLATAVRDAQPYQANQEEIRIGHMVSDKLAQALVDELRSAGIHAVRAGRQVSPTKTTGIVSGQFLSVDQGNQSARVWLGFGLGGSELRTQVEIVQDNRLVAQAETATRSNLKPGMLVSIGASGVAESAVPAVVGAGATGVNEALLSGVEADAKRTAKEVTRHIRQAYINRGWLLP